MNPISINKSIVSPKVVFDPSKNIFEIAGPSRPENTSEFYAPLIHWLENYQSVLTVKKEQSPRIFDFKLEYFNTTSAKFIMDILMQLDRMAENGCNVKAKWHYDKRDEDMKEAGSKFSKLLKELEVEFVEM